MQQEKNKCPQCGQYKLHPRRTALMSTGIFLLFVQAILILFDPFFLTARYILGTVGTVVFVGSLFVKGQVCANCHYSSLHAHA